MSLSRWAGTLDGREALVSTTSNSDRILLYEHHYFVRSQSRMRGDYLFYEEKIETTPEEKEAKAARRCVDAYTYPLFSRMTMPPALGER